MTADRGPSEMLTLQAQLAYSAARSDVECYCYPVGTWSERWHDSGDVRPEEDRGTVAIALRYLDLRGLIERHENGVWVRVREEDAPW